MRMSRIVRISVWIITIWTVTCCLFLLISYPEVFNIQTTKSFVQSQRSELNTFMPGMAEKQDIDTKNNILLGSYKNNVSYLHKLPNLPLGNVNVARGNVTQQNVENRDHKNLAKELRLQREEKERRYYTLRQTKVNPINVKYFIAGAQICSSDAKYMTILIIVPSIPRHYFVRDSIRSTYGSYVKETFGLEHTNVEVSVRLAFLVGKDNTSDSDSIVRNESRKYGDIIYADFIESYSNLTRKMLIVLSWVSVYCSDIDFMLKVDEDVFVNIPKLANELRKRPYDIQGSIYGYLYRSSPVRRYGKWAVPLNEFPLGRYPTYAAGNSYVISGNIISRLYSASEYLPYLSIEDAFITGCLARIIDAKLVHIPGFTHWDSAEPDPCKFVRDRGISVTKVTTSKMEKLWKACTNYKEYCDWRNLKKN